VAVLTPTFNQERYITAAIQSVLSQSFRNWEMIVMDDGSSDGTVAAVETLSDPRIRLLRRPHGGLGRLGAAYAAGLAATEAPLVAILEGDDEWPQDKLERQLRLFDDPYVVLAYGAAHQIDDAGCVYATYRRRPPGTAADNRPLGSILPFLLRQNFIVAATVMVRRQALNKVGGFWQPPGIPYVDHPTWLRLALDGPFAYSPEVAGRWRRHAEQFTTVRATGPQPDNRAFLAEVLAEAGRRDLVPAASRLDHMVASGPSRHARWAQASNFRLVLLHGSVGEALTAARPVFRSGGAKWMTLAVAGVALRLMGSDLEWVFRLTNRFSWPSRRHAHHS
jgi:glycosyltransferase involved in cell wall biosynthesis